MLAGWPCHMPPSVPCMRLGRSALQPPATAALLTPTESEPHRTHQPCRHGYPGAICSASTRCPTSQGSNGFDPTTPCRRKGRFQHPKAAQGIPVSLTPILAIKESSGHSEASKLPRPWSKVELSNPLRALWAQEPGGPPRCPQGRPSQAPPTDGQAERPRPLQPAGHKWPGSHGRSS